MDELNLTPDAIQTNDSTSEIEGYDDQIEQIEQAYPEEDFRTPAEQSAQAEANQPEQAQAPTEQPQIGFDDIANLPPEQLQQISDQLGIPQQQEQPQVQPEPVPEQPKEPPQHLAARQYDETTGLVNEDSILDAEGKQINTLANGSEVIQALKLTRDYNPEKEDMLIDLFSTADLSKRLEGFNMIRNDPELTEIYDSNGDGQVTYNDFHDTTHMNGGDGMTDEEDALATQEWLAGLADPDVGARARAVWQKYGAGQNMALFVAKRRKQYFDPTWQEDWKEAGGGAWFDIGADALETVGSIGDVLQGKSWHEDSTFDDNILQQKNVQSMEFLVNNPLVNTEHTKDIYNGTYWVTTAALAATGYKAAGAGVTGLGAPGLGKAITGLTTTGLGKGIVADTVVPGVFRNYQEHGIGMMRQKGVIEWTTDHYGGASELFGPTVANGINSPHFKKFDSIFTEAGAAFAAGKMLIHGGKLIWNGGKQLRAGMGNAAKWSQKNLDQFATSTKSWSTKLDAEMLNQEAFFKRSQEQLTDIAEAGREQLKKGSEGFRNAFIGNSDDPKILYGAYKNGASMIGQGYSKARSGIRQVINDLDEIRHTVGTSHTGSTDSLFSITEMAKAAKGGITDSKIGKFAKELVEDGNWKKQLDSVNPLKRVKPSRRIGSEAAQKSIQEVMGRDAAALDPAEYWGKELLDAPLNAEKFEKLSDFDQWAVKNMEVQDAVNQSLLKQLRDSANVSSEMIGKTDIYAVDGAMKRIANNLVTGLSQVKKTQYTWDLARTMMREGNGKLTQEQLIDLAAQSGKRASELHNETRQGVQLMFDMLQEQGDDELAGALLDVFKVSNDVHNWKDFDAWMRSKIKGGEFNGQVKTGAMIHELQGVMVQSILSGPKTPLRAILGTTTNAYLNAINEAFGAVIRSPFTNDVASQKASIAKLKGMFELIPEGWDVFKKNWHAKFNANIADVRTRYSEAPTKNDNLWNAEREWTEARGTDGDKAALYITNTARNLTNNKLFGWSPRALAATDDTFKWLLARARSKEIAMRQALEVAGDDFTKITPDLLKQAEDVHYNHLLDGEGNINLAKDSWLKKQFEEVTLTSELKGFSQKLDSLFNSAPLVKPFYLFARTGVNGLNLTFKNTPLLGALHKESLAIMRHTGNDFTDLARYGIDNANDLANARNLLAGRQAVGTTVVSGIGGMYMAGQLTGNGPADRQLKQNWINAGWKPNHIYIGDVGFDYTTLEPYNVIFSSIADIGDNIELMGSEWAEKRLQAVAYVMGRGLQGKTYMSGLDQMMQIIQMKPGAMNKAAGNVLNNSIPLAGMRNEFGKWANPHMKELNSSMWDSIRNRNQATEFLAGENQLPEKSDILNGKPIRNWNIVGRSVNAISPIQIDIRNDTPGRRLLLDSNYDLKSTVYSYGGYSFVKNAKVRSEFQREIGSVPIEVGFKKFKNVEEALNHLATRDDVKESMAKMQADGKNPANWDIDPNNYPHNTLIDNVMNQARAKAFARLNQPNHPGNAALEEVKADKDGLDSKTRKTREDIINLSFPNKQVEQFPKN